ncbi:MAG: HlyD family secretion protein [Candidatus Wallbacteria bacterium]|nr:HlyD family secretion protein [Candidatus Wallbacteria bacterium]
MSESKKQKNGKPILIAVCLLLAMAIFAFFYWFFFMYGIVYSDDARIEGEMIDLSPHFSGDLVQIAVREGDMVKKDQLLFELDRKPLEVALLKSKADLAAAKAGLAVAQAQYDKAFNGPLTDEIRISKAAMDQADAQFKQVGNDWQRIKVLSDKQVISDSERDKARTLLETSQQAYESAKSKLELLKKGTRSEELRMAEATLQLREAEVGAAEASVQQAEVNLGYVGTLAPFDGVVTRRWRDPGSMVMAGTPILSLLDPKSLYIAANVEERYLSCVAVNDRTDVSVDAYPDLKLTGRVTKILAAANSQFSLIPSEGVSGTFIKVSQRVPIRIKLDTIPAELVGPGLSVVVHIHIGSSEK